MIQEIIKYLNKKVEAISSSLENMDPQFPIPIRLKGECNEIKSWVEFLSKLIKLPPATCNKQESIICSAIWYKDLSTPVYGPKNVDKGIVFCGHRHPHCLHQMVSMTGKRQCEVGEEVQGFLTNTNRFVDREEGAKIALECKQITHLNYSNKTLYSEDLY